MKSVKQIRCAIYTRVSTDQGLDQEFNSLDAQREASEAYIKSQAHEGWTCLKQTYNDGGYSGGSMERPALQSLLEDVRAKKLDVIVVYKVDRLTRSLADFAKLVELFDANGASFVSVTQSFNTTSSMGRLTLNVLLSFAQFEREVTGERIRDKVAASRKKGMWMGGPVPLGYRLKDRKLQINASEAEKVRYIFGLYIELKSLPQLAKALATEQILSRSRQYTDGRTRGGQPFRTGALSHLLANRIYIGEVRHHKQHFKGEHELIVDRTVFDAVQSELTERLNRKKRSVQSSGAMLKGLLFDSNGNRMTPSHAKKGGVRYRYYQSWVLNEGLKEKAGIVSRVPAQDIEQVVLEAVHSRLRDQSAACDDTKSLANHVHTIERVVLLQGHLKIVWKNAQSAAGRQDQTPQSAETFVHWTKPPKRRRRNLIGEINNAIVQRPIRSETRSRLLKGIAQGRIWLECLLSRKSESIQSIALVNKLSEKSVRSILSLALLAPEIVQAAIGGQLPRNLTVSQMTDLPFDWTEQRRVLELV